MLEFPFSLDRIRLIKLEDKIPIFSYQFKHMSSDRAGSSQKNAQRINITVNQILHCTLFQHHSFPFAIFSILIQNFFYELRETGTGIKRGNDRKRERETYRDRAIYIV